MEKKNLKDEWTHQTFYVLQYIEKHRKVKLFLKGAQLLCLLYIFTNWFLKFPFLILDS